MRDMVQIGLDKEHADITKFSLTKPQTQHLLKLLDAHEAYMVQFDKICLECKAVRMQIVHGIKELSWEKQMELKRAKVKKKSKKIKEQIQQELLETMPKKSADSK